MPTGAESYLLHHLLDFNPSRAAVLEARRQRAEAGRLGARVRWKTDQDGEFA